MPTFIYPVGNVAIAQGFNPPNHQGVDFSVPVGTPVHAAADGTVIYEANESLAGNTITIQHVPNGWQTRYDHLSVFRVGTSQVVKSGDVIGLSGGAQGSEGSGNSTGPHLHFEIRSDPNTPVNPIPLLGGTSNVPDQGSGTPSGASSGGGGTNPLEAIKRFFEIISDGKTWIRIGEILGSLSLFWISYTILSKDLSSFSELRSAISG